MGLTKEQAVPVSVFFVVIWAILFVGCIFASILSFTARMNKFFKTTFILNGCICITRLIVFGIRIPFILAPNYAVTTVYNVFFAAGIGIYFSMFVVITAEWARILAKMSHADTADKFNKIINWALYFLLGFITIMTTVNIILRFTDTAAGVNTNFFLSFIIILSSLGIMVLMVMIVLANKVRQLVRQTKTADQIGAMVMVRLSVMVTTFTIALLARWIFYIIYVVNLNILNTDAGAYIQYFMNFGAEWVACFVSFLFCASTLVSALRGSKNTGKH